MSFYIDKTRKCSSEFYFITSFFFFLAVQKTSDKLLATIWGEEVDYNCIISDSYVSTVSTFIFKK